MMRRVRLRRSLSRLGLEDLIPLPEALDLGLALQPGHPRGEVLGSVAEAPTRLLSSGQIQVFSGKWGDDPAPAQHELARALLNDSASYVFAADGRDDVRVYFVNVDNYSEPTD